MHIGQYLGPSEINAFIYCKRNWYYRTQLKLPFLNESMKIGKYVHEHFWLDTIKRKEIYLISHKWKLKGRCDYIIEEKGMQIPLEIKYGNCNNEVPYQNDAMQLLCYILLLGGYLNEHIPYGYILYVTSKRKYKVNNTLSYRKMLRSIIRSMHAYMNGNIFPNRTDYTLRCYGCSFMDYCWC
ncbi:MAG: CRISPR-associated protein Cas4 [Candidatus Lokiarchaeota archaeon]|nr:CRISPR-associated protein Cas4 [Candidatus Lokiarchaeota archaeon]